MYNVSLQHLQFFPIKIMGFIQCIYNFSLYLFGLYPVNICSVQILFEQTTLNLGRFWFRRETAERFVLRLNVSEYHLV